MIALRVFLCPEKKWYIIPAPVEANLTHDEVRVSCLPVSIQVQETCWHHLSTELPESECDKGKYEVGIKRGMHAGPTRAPNDAPSCQPAHAPIHQSLFEQPGAQPSLQNSGKTVDVFTGKSSFEPPSHTPLVDTLDDSDILSFRSAIRAHDPLVRLSPQSPPLLHVCIPASRLVVYIPVLQHMECFFCLLGCECCIVAVHTLCWLACRGGARC
jgi:hypothetical protein